MSVFENVAHPKDERVVLNAFHGVAIRNVLDVEALVFITRTPSVVFVLQQLKGG
jgi:hypothetical protein